MAPKIKRKLFHSAKEERVRHKKKKEVLAQTAYRLAYLDDDFLLRRELRSVRLQLELLKPELMLHDEKVFSTVVVFGSARIHEPKVTAKELEEAKLALEKDPKNPKLIQAKKIAQSIHDKSSYYEDAVKLSKLIAQNSASEGSEQNLVVTTGGGPGIMEAANRGSHEANVKSIGLNISLPMEQEPNPYISPELNFQFHYFAVRKMHFLIRARALIAFPGGFGTLDEIFEALTLLQTQKINPMPVILFGEEFWRKIINFEALVEEGTISPEDMELFTYVETAEEAWKVIDDFYHASHDDGDEQP